MIKLSGLVLDRYDDVVGSFRNVHTEAFEKIARRFTSDELNRLPDETFAVILHDGDTTLKKFSMADLGNAAISIEYFMHTRHKLPEEAQKVAAANLLKACDWYGLQPPSYTELHKIAFGVNTLLAAAEVPGAVRESGKNLAASRGTGGAIMTPQQIKQQRLQMGV